MKTLIEIHVLQNFAPSNLNRDDTGAPKDALFGGTRRARISSQCLKRAVRQDFLRKREQGFFKPDELAIRTKRLYKAVADQFAGKRSQEEALAKVETALSYVKLKAAEGGKTQYLLYLGQNEIDKLAETVDQYWDSIVPAAAEPKEKGKTKGKRAAAGEAPQDVRDAVDAVFKGGKAVDLALFGRMLADMPENNQHAACQVAHAISTHSVQREFDYYTAVDDLKPEDTSGADMMGTVEFNSACFYRYAVVDWEKFGENLHNDRELACRGLRAFLEAFILAEPTGKQNTFAAHNPPEFVAVSVRRDAAPRNLANAFEAAVRVAKHESLTETSVHRLLDKAGRLNRAYDAAGKTWVLNLTDAKMEGFGTAVDSLTALLDATLTTIED
ncbi:MAG: type I-E CRISPR-associated protein Cas7/Cse4/CasC [Patescibacteria group bacterium]|nr:type I-E CRISPR-associated protein Cas7/Cse4/CasC [Patescibacteria group bacterium]